MRDSYGFWRGFMKDKVTSDVYGCIGGFLGCFDEYMSFFCMY